MLLIFTTGIVVSILYVAASEFRWWYAAFAVAATLAIPRIVPDGAGDPGRLQVTLAIWAVLSAIIEWYRRRLPADEQGPEADT